MHHHYIILITSLFCHALHHLQLQAQEHEGRYKQASLEHDRLEDQCKDDAETAKENFLKLQASCQEGDRQLQGECCDGLTVNRPLQCSIARGIFSVRLAHLDDWSVSVCAHVMHASF